MQGKNKRRLNSSAWYGLSSLDYQSTSSDNTLLVCVNRAKCAKAVWDGVVIVCEKSGVSYKILVLSVRFADRRVGSVCIPIV